MLFRSNLIEAGNILGSVFYGVPLALFLVGVFLRWIHGTAVFLSAVITQVLIIVFYFNLSISYLWYNLIGCLICVGLAFLLEAVLRTLGRGPRPAAA